MKACPNCARLYPDDAGFCPADGSRLLDADQVAVAPDARDGRVGQVLCDRYQVRRIVADGGMGRVYEALEWQENRNVALKVLHPEVALDEVAVERFRREFEVSKQLPHRHIVDVFDFQPTHDQSYALVMEYLYGEELRATLKRERVIAPERLVRMVSQAAIALDAAHERKFVHRDLKPDNLFLCQTAQGDTLKILDFGSVKDTTERAKKLTVMGTTIGSPFYMSPEQAQGLDTLDQRADVWALAAIVYECVTGQVPFRGNNGPSILLAILSTEPVPPSRAGADQRHPLPTSLDAVIAAGLRKLASERHGSAGAFADGLGHAYGLSGSHVAWAQTSQQQLGSWIAAGAAGPARAAPPPSTLGRAPAPGGKITHAAPRARNTPGGAALRRSAPTANQVGLPAARSSSSGLLGGLLLGGALLLLAILFVLLAW